MPRSPIVTFPPVPRSAWSRAAGPVRAAALVASAAVLLATTVPECVESGSASYGADTTCGPPGVIALAFSGETDPGCGACWAFLEAPGAGAAGLPEQGEIHSGSRLAFENGDFALVGPAPVAGASPPRSVRRTCAFTPAGEDVLEVACTGDDPEAACGGTLTLVPAGGAP